MTNFTDFTEAGNQIESVLRKAMNGKQKDVAEVIGWSEGKLSRFKNGQSDEKATFGEVVALLAALGLSVVSSDSAMVAGEDLKALRYLAKLGSASLFERTGTAS